MPRIQDVKIRRYKQNRDFWEVVGPRGSSTVRSMDRASLRTVAGARRRLIIKKALRKVGVTKYPRSLTKGVLS